MKRSLYLGFPLLTTSVVLSQSAVPNAISYQGRVSDAAGALIGDPAPVNREVTLRIYSSSNSSSPLYSEKQTVTVNKGVFSVLLGQGLAVGSEPHPAISSVFDNSDRFLGITVDDGSAAIDPEITPRQQIVSTAFAFRSKMAESANAAVTANLATLATVATTANGVEQPAGTSNMDVLNVNNFTVNGHSKIMGNNVLELGTGIVKGASNGTIGYNAYGTGALDIVGAGAGINDRRIVFHAQGGSDFLGSVKIDPGSLSFGGRLGQHINLWGNDYGMGIQNSSFYSRTGGQFVWFKGGSHNDNSGESGGGTTLAALSAGGLYLPAGPVDRGNSHNVFYQSYGGGHSIGSQNYTTFLRTAGVSGDQNYNGSFNFYAGGSYSNPGNGERSNDPGSGTTLAILTSMGLKIMGPQHVNQEPNAGLIGYKTFSNGLDIVGAGTGADRTVTVYAEAGTRFTGPLILDNATKWAGGGYYGFGGDADNYGNNGVQNVNNQGAFNVVMSAQDGRLIANSFTAVSDERLKNIVGVSDGARDLNALTRIQVTDYTMKDDKSKKPRQTKKVIAQQLEQVFPQAVGAAQGVVPDLLTPTTAKAGFVTLTKALPAAVKKGDVLKIFGNNPKSGQSDSMLVKVAETNKEGIQLEEKFDGKIFLYGHQVSDLRSVDYEAISMLNVSATQELNRTIEAQKAEIKALTEARTALEKELAAAKEVNAQQDTRLAAIEKALKATAQTDAPKKAGTTKVATTR